MNVLEIDRGKLNAPWRAVHHKESITINNAQGHILARLQRRDVPNLDVITLLIEFAPDLLTTVRRQKHELADLAAENLSQMSEITGLKHRIKMLEEELKTYYNEYPIPPTHFP